MDGPTDQVRRIFGLRPTNVGPMDCNNGPLIHVGESYFETNGWLPTCSSEDCTQKRFWNFGHNSDLLSKNYILVFKRLWSLICEALVAFE